MDLKQIMVSHAKERPKEEVCGLVVSFGKNKYRIVRARNLSDRPNNSFDLDPDAHLEVGKDEKVIGFYHSHPSGDPTPSPADMVACEESGVTMHIVTVGGGYSCTDPTGYSLPYKGRTYVPGVIDCFSLIRDWYNREWGLGMPNLYRQSDWWRKGQNLYVDHFEEYGFVQLIDQPVEHGDAFLIQVVSEVPNHAAIWLHGGKILHHPENRLSGESPWTGFWSRHASHHLRHKSRLDHG